MASPSMSVSTPPNRDTAPVVSVRGVAHTYGTTRALDGISLDIPAGSWSASSAPTASASRRSWR